MDQPIEIILIFMMFELEWCRMNIRMKGCNGPAAITEEVD
jgi:hypothetical protein